MTLSLISEWIGNSVILSMVVGIPVYGYFRKVPVYDTFITGAKEGLPMLVRLLPYFIGMLVAIGMLRASGAFDLLNHLLAPVMTYLGIPAEVIPVAIMRPFSGSAATALTAEIIQAHGGNSYYAHLSAILMTATEATFYVTAIYCGAASIRNIRHTLTASLITDMIATLAAVWIANLILLKAF